MDAGRMRHLVQFEELVVDLDSDGQQQETWIPAFGGQLISAEISPLSGRELIAAAAVQAKVSTRIVVRYRPGILPTMRVIHRGVFFGIEAVIPDAESGIDHITLLCTSGVSDG